MSLLIQYYLASLLILLAGANLQSWSEQTYLDKPYILTCNSTTGNLTVTAGDVLSWKKLGSEDEITSNSDYELLNDNGVTNFRLKIKKVTPEMSGIYFCYVTSSGSSEVWRVVKGLNVVEPLYEDKFDEYRTNVIRGVISAASVFVLVVGVGVIDRFRYLTPEQKQERRERKEERLRRQGQPQNGGVDNFAMDNGELNIQTPKSNGSPPSPVETYTHF